MEATSSGERSQEGARRSLQPVGLVARVVAKEAPARARELGRDERQEQQAEEDVHGQEVVKGERGGRLDHEQPDQREPERRRQPLVAGGPSSQSHRVIVRTAA